jgi:hypothetical protein
MIATTDGSSSLMEGSGGRSKPRYSRRCQNSNNNVTCRSSAKRAFSNPEHT